VKAKPLLTPCPRHCHGNVVVKAKPLLTPFPRYLHDDILLLQTLNPTDMIDDTIRNFSSSYSHYHQGEQGSTDEEGAGNQREQATVAAGDPPAVPSAFPVRTRRNKIADTSLLLTDSEDEVI